MTAMARGRSGFRQDIQGLRALAVLLVALDHAHVGPFHGGYVGVDVFFVISGFLITGLLVAEAESTGRVSLIGFYARRARRILPAASLVILSTVAAATVLLSAVDASATIEDAVWATFFAANFKFSRDGTDYFHADAIPSPLQHYWSLAVEEQFYLVWPLLVLLLCLVAARVASTRARPRERSVRAVAVPLLVVIAVGSFVWSVAQTGDGSVAAYFSPFTRAWELALGGLTACLAPRLARVPSAAMAGLSWVGLVGVLAAALLFDGSTPFPGYAAALPVLATALLLAGGLVPARRGPQPLLELGPVRTIGDWSYSIYLWHWPALVILAAVWRQPSGWSGLLVLVAVVALSGLTYHLVENPWRRMGGLRLRRLGGVLLYPAVVVLTLPLLAGAQALVEHEVSGGGPAITTEQFGAQPGDPDPRFSDDPVEALVEASVLAAQNGMEVPGNLSPSLLDLEDDIADVGECEYFFINHDRPLCARGDAAADRTLVLIGDSHARQWIPALDELTERHGWRAYYLVRQGCPASDVTPMFEDGSGPNKHCESFQDWVVRQLEDLRPELVLMSSEANPAGFLDDDGEVVDDLDGMLPLFEQGMERQIDRVRPLTDRVVLIGDPPGLPFSPGRCLSARDATLADCMGPGTTRSERVTQALRDAASATGTQFVETGSWFCARGQCPTVIGSYIARRDATHASVEYAEHLSDVLESQLHLARPPE
jgi:peptidoglycan/LPS O-acetylase OafA/YrhL